MTPEDIERGELVYTLPLTPKEKVTISSGSATPLSLKFSRKSCTSSVNSVSRMAHSLCEIHLRQPRHHVVDRVWSWTSFNRRSLSAIQIARAMRAHLDSCSSALDQTDWEVGIGIERSPSPVFDCLLQHVARTVAGEVALQLGGVRFVARARAQDDAALVDTALVSSGPLLGNARADQRAEQRPVAPPAPAPAMAPAIGPATTRPSPGIAIAVAAATSAPSAARTPNPIPPPMPAPSAAFEPSLSSCPGFTSPKWRNRACPVTSAR